jgi:hypothetical protein
MLECKSRCIQSITPFKQRWFYPIAAPHHTAEMAATSNTIKSILGRAIRETGAALKESGNAEVGVVVVSSWAQQSAKR